MISVLNFDGKKVSIMVDAINYVIHTGGQSCTIMMKNGDAVFCTEPGDDVRTRIDSYINNNRYPQT